MTATFYDHRAERVVAGAEAEARRAEAEATRAETALRIEEARQRMAAERDRQERQDRESAAAGKAARRRMRRQERAQARANGRASMRAGGRALAAAVVTRAPMVVGVVAMGAPILIAWDGQLAFAEDKMHLGALSWALPVALEGAAWYLAYLTHRAIKAHLPAGRYRVWTWGLAAIAAAMNAWHGIEKYATQADAWAGLQVGVILALASLLGIGLWELTASLAQHAESKRSAAEIRRAAWRRIRYPRMSWQAASIRAARGADCTIDDAWSAAWADRHGIGPDASRRDRALARSIVRHQGKADRAAAKSGRLSIAGGAIVGRPSTAPDPVESEPVESAAPVVEVEQLDAPAPAEIPPGESADLPAIDAAPIPDGPADRPDQGPAVDVAEVEHMADVDDPTERESAAVRPAPAVMQEADDLISEVLQILRAPVADPTDDDESADRLAAVAAAFGTAQSGVSRPTVPAPVFIAPPPVDPTDDDESADSARRESARTAAARPGVSRPTVADRTAPRRSLDEHRAALAEAIASGELPAAPTAEAIRTTLRCSQNTARTLHHELAGEVAA